MHKYYSIPHHAHQDLKSLQLKTLHIPKSFSKNPPPYFPSVLESKQMLHVADIPVNMNKNRI